MPFYTHKTMLELLMFSQRQNIIKKMTENHGNIMFRSLRSGKMASANQRPVGQNFAKLVKVGHVGMSSIYKAHTRRGGYIQS